MHEDVGQLQVSVQYIQIIDGLEAFDNLTHEISSFLLRKATSNLSEIIQVTTVAVLHEKVEVISCLLYVEESDHVGTLYPRQDAYFTLKILLKTLIQVLLFDDFTSHPYFLVIFVIWFFVCTDGVLFSCVRKDNLPELSFAQNS